MTTGVQSTVKAGPAQAQRVYYAPRLDAAFAYQAVLERHGKRRMLILTALTVLGGSTVIFGLIGLAAYWWAVFKNKDELEALEKQLYLATKQDQIAHDISGSELLSLKYMPYLMYGVSILAVCYFIAKPIIRYMWNHGR